VALESRGEIGDVGGVEANGRAEVHGLEVAALDETLDGPGVDVEEAGSFGRRQERVRGSRRD
jgi:hypothetical protein